MLTFTVDPARCTKCGLCELDCPSRIIEIPAGGTPLIRSESEERCLRCQHCLAVCPTAAISILGRDPADSIPLAVGSFPTLEQMTRLVKGRRSVRQYKDQNVNPVLLQQLLTTLTNAPSGVNRMAVTFSVIDDKAAMQRFRIKTLTRQTRIDNARFFGGDVDAVPTHCLTQGLGTIMAARHIVLVATGPQKAEAVHHLVEGAVSALWPGTILQHHPHVTVLLDGAAASRLQLADYYRETYQAKPAWQGI